MVDRATAILASLLRAAIVASLLMVGCGSNRMDPGSDALRNRRAEFARAANRQHEAILAAMLKRMEVESADPDRDAVFDVLALHGGGMAAAFSAGFLTGWDQVRDPSLVRPQFDLVTGSSTGALIALFAFLGDRASYSEIFDIFCDFPDDVFRGPSVLSFWPSRAGLLDQKPLARFVRNAFQDRHVEAVARGADESRVFLAVTTDLDLGLQRLWRLGVEAQAARHGGIDRFHQILMASSAVPVLYPPVEIDGELHNDGAVSGSLVIGFGLSGIDRIAKAWATKHGTSRVPTIRVWAILNQPLFTPEQTVPPRYLDVGARSLDIALEYDRQKALLYLANFIARINARNDMNAELHWTAIPESIRLPRKLGRFGDPIVMRHLAELGAHMGRDPGSWRSGEPQVEFLPETPPAFEKLGSIRGYCPGSDG